VGEHWCRKGAKNGGRVEWICEADVQVLQIQRRTIRLLLLERLLVGINPVGKEGIVSDLQVESQAPNSLPELWIRDRRDVLPPVGSVIRRVRHMNFQVLQVGKTGREGDRMIELLVTIHMPMGEDLYLSDPRPGYIGSTGAKVCAEGVIGVQGCYRRHHDGIGEKLVFGGRRIIAKYRSDDQGASRSRLIHQPRQELIPFSGIPWVYVQDGALMKAITAGSAFGSAGILFVDRVRYSPRTRRTRRTFAALVYLDAPDVGAQVRVLHHGGELLQGLGGEIWIGLVNGSRIGFPNPDPRKLA
jgi:hypothetical protein